MKQTAVEFLKQKLIYIFINDEGFNKLFEQAKEMEKQQIIEAHGTKTKKSAGIANYLYTLSGEQYYNETYGSDDHIVDTKEMEKAATISKKEMVEISDEEIETLRHQYFKENGIWSDKTDYFIKGAKWYREQLKSRQ